MKKLVAAFAIAASIAAVAPAMAQPNSDFRHPGGGWGQDLRLQGMRVDDAKNSLRANGYSHARNISVGGKQYDLWSNSRSRDSCLGFTSYNGRVTDTRGFNDSECGVVSGRRLEPRDLQGMRVDDAKRNLRDYGYRNVRNVRLDGRQWDLWLDGRGRDCVGFTSYNGKLTDARSFRANECDGYGNPGGGRWLEARDLRGLSVDNAKRSLSDAGFRKARNIHIRGAQWDLWYDDSGRNDRCIGFTSYNGRVTDADNFSSRDCR